MGCHSFTFKVFRRDGSLRVALHGRGIDSPVEDAFLFDCSPDTQVEAALENISENVCTFDDLRYVGEQLWIALTSKTVGGALRMARASQDPKAEVEFRLDLTDDVRGFPWETLYDKKIGFWAGKSKFNLVQHPPEEAEFGPAQARPANKPHMLIIVPMSSGLNSAEERNAIARHASEQVFVQQVLTRSVTSDRVHKVLSMEGPWDIVHYIGHGRINETTQRTEILLENASGGDYWQDAEVFADDFGTANVGLAVMNCCLSAGSAERCDSLNGLGPLLMRAGVPAVVAMRYAISDRMARIFSDAFYGAFFNSPAAGRVDLATQVARDAMKRNQENDELRSFITPVLYLAPGFEKLFDFPVKESHDEITDVGTGGTVQPSRGGSPLPAELRSAIEKGRCVPIIGPGVLAVGATRDGHRPPPGPLELALQLAKDQQWPYPCPEDIDLCEKAGDWMSAQLLQWVSQYHNLKQNGLGDLIDRIKEIYKQATPTKAIERLARWEVPAMFYTYFDGLLDERQRSGRSSFTNTIRRVDEAPAVDAAMVENQRLLVLVRGSIFDNSFVLTETQNEKLISQIVRMNQQIANLALKPGRSVLFLGVSPRDFLVRQLGQKLLQPISDSVQGPIFFVCPRHSQVDDAYWKRFSVKWIEEDLEVVLPALLDIAP
jgi:hypothetical protein